MAVFILKRLFLTSMVLACVVTLTFLLLRIAPGSPFASERKGSDAAEAARVEKYHLDGTLLEQLGWYWKGLLQGDLGTSTKYPGRSVQEIIGQTLPASLTIGSLALILSLVTGTILGSYAAVHHNQTRDRAAMLLALLGICMPSFVLAPIFVLLLAILIPLFPVAGWGAPAHLVLPILCLGLPYGAYCARLMRTSMLEVLNQDFIRTAHAKGLNEKVVVYRHALRVAAMPLVSYSGPLAAHILTGSLVVEEIFKVPGIGPFFVNSVFNRDVFLMGGCVLVYFGLLVGFNLVVDILYTFLDKRVKLS